MGMIEEYGKIPLMIERSKEARALRDAAFFLHQLGVPVGEVSIHPLTRPPTIKVWRYFDLTLEEVSELFAGLDERTDRYQEIGGNIGRWDDGREITPKSAEEFEAAVDAMAAEMESQKRNEKTSRLRDAALAASAAPGAAIGGKR